MGASGGPAADDIAAMAMGVDVCPPLRFAGTFEHAGGYTENRCLGGMRAVLVQKSRAAIRGHIISTPASSSSLSGAPAAAGCRLPAQAASGPAPVSCAWQAAQLLRRQYEGSVNMSTELRRSKGAAAGRRRNQKTVRPLHSHQARHTPFHTSTKMTHDI